MKLSNTQQKAIEKMREKIDKARECNTYEEWFRKYHAFRYNPNRIDKLIERRELEEYYNLEKNENIVIVTENTKTLERLQKEGLIEIVDTGEKFPDTVKVLNY